MDEMCVQLLPFVIWSVLSLIPALSICKRVGKARWWSVIAVLPFIGPVIFMFIIAYSQWGRGTEEMQRELLRVLQATASNPTNSKSGD
jgi:hypothetical protein